MIISDEQIQKFRKLIGNASSIVLIPHQNPDGDAIGSILGWWNIFRRRGLDAKVVVPDEVPANLLWMNGSGEILIYDNDPGQSRQVIGNADLFFFMDFNSIDRAGDMAEILSQTHASRILIDHHPRPVPGIADLLFSDTSVSSTCELSYHLIQALGWSNDLDILASGCLYAGIITDTGSLSYNSSHPRTYHSVADLVGRGIDKEMIHKELFQSNSYTRMKLLGHVLCDKLELMEDSYTAFIAISKDELDEFNYQPGDTEGFVNYPLGIKGVDISALFTEREKNKFVKISMRSRGHIPINLYSEEFFSGGGHPNAAGGEWYGTLDEAIARFRATLPGFIAQLPDHKKPVNAGK